MKAKVKILLNGAAATVLTSAVAAGLVLASSGVFRVKGEQNSARELQTVADTLEQEESESIADILYSDKMLLKNNWEEETLTVSSETEEETESETVKRNNPLDEYFQDKAIVNEALIDSCLNVRSAADESSELVDVLTGNSLLNIISAGEDWSEIAGDGFTGWVRTEYLLTGSDAADFVLENGDAYARVTVPNMNIRLRASTESDILAVAYEGDTYRIDYSQNDWVYVDYAAQIRGFMSGDCVALTYMVNDLRIDTDIALNDSVAADAGITVQEAVKEIPVVFESEALVTGSDNNSIDISQVVMSAAAQYASAAENTISETQPVIQETTPAAETVIPAETPAAEVPVPAETPAAEAPVPAETAPQTTPAETLPVAASPSLVGIEAFYRGGSKTAGDVVCRAEVYVVASFSDGSSAVVEDGWTSGDIGMMLNAGENVITVGYGGFSSNIVLPAAAPAPTETVPQTTPAETVPQTQPVPTETTAPTPTEPPAPETQPSVSGRIRVSNVNLSSELTAYTLQLCSAYGIDSSVVFSVMYQESNFNPSAMSGSGAAGLMQIIPRYSTARMAKLGVTNIMDPASNILVGVDMLAEYYYTYGGWAPALTRYRTGDPNAASSYANMILSRVGLFQTIYYE